MPSFQFGTRTIAYTLDYQHNKKDVSIFIEWKTGVSVIAPTGLDDEKLQHILKSKAKAILTKLNDLEEIHDLSEEKAFLSGEKIPYLGRNYRLKITPDETALSVDIKFNQGKFLVTIPSYLNEGARNEEIQLAFEKWFMTYGQSKINERMKLYIEKMGVSPGEVKIKKQKTRWGTCTPEGNIYVNWQLLTAPMKIIDYVLVHELAHLKHMNHGPDYWGFVKSILPDYEERKEWLRVNGPNLKL